MFRRYALAALTFAAMACGDDSKDPTPAADAGTADAAVAPVVGKATEVGVACTADTDCKGASARCLKNQSLPLGAGTINFTGGYCSATCADATECAAAGDSTSASCPFAPALKLGGGAAAALGPLLSGLSVCLKKCSTDSDCRSPGYACQTIQDQLKAAAPAGGGGGLSLDGIIGTIVEPGKFCVSTDTQFPDAGTPAPTDAGATDAGATDAGTSDAAAEDAGATDAGATDAGTADAGDAA